MWSTIKVWHKKRISTPVFVCPSSCSWQYSCQNCCNYKFRGLIKSENIRTRTVETETKTSPPFWCCPVVKEEVKLANRTNYRDVPRLRAQIVLALYCHISFQKEGVGAPAGDLCVVTGALWLNDEQFDFTHTSVHHQKLLLRSGNKYNSPDSCSNSPFQIINAFQGRTATIFSDTLRETFIVRAPQH